MSYLLIGEWQWGVGVKNKWESEHPCANYVQTCEVDPGLTQFRKISNFASLKNSKMPYHGWSISQILGSLKQLKMPDMSGIH